MTEKRFIFREDYDWWEIKDTTGQIKGDYDEWFSCEKVVDLLNVLHEENEQLRKEIEDLNWELTEIKKSEYDNYNITDGLW